MLEWLNQKCYKFFNKPFSNTSDEEIKIMLSSIKESECTHDCENCDMFDLCFVYDLDELD